MNPYLRSMLLGLAAVVMFFGIADLAWDGRARSLIIPQVALLALVCTLAWFGGPETKMRWRHPAVAAATFYILWAAGHLLFVTLFDQPSE